MMSPVALCCLVTGLVVGQAWANALPLQSLPLQSESHPLSLVSDLSSRLGAHPSRLQEARLPGLSLPSSQDIEAIKKVAQILVMLGQQVIPAIIGEAVSPLGSFDPASGGDEIPNDPVNINDRQA